MGVAITFTELFFLYLFLPLSAVFYFLAKTKYRSYVLIVCSLLFYAWGEPVYVWLLLFITCMNYVLGRLISGTDTEGEENPKLQKAALALGLLLNIGLLAGVKYIGTLLGGVQLLTGAAISIPGIHIPLGLSFYSFRAISYLADCYWGKIRAESRFSNFLLYMSLFPLVAQGPVVQYDTIHSELAMRQTNVLDLGNGIGRFILGLAKKVLIADQLGLIADQFLGGEAIAKQSMLGAWYGVIVFTLELYFDLSGYSDMAIGLGRIFGFHLEENFDHPLMSGSVTGFWKRWYISLGVFFREYVMRIPLLERCGKKGSILLTWLLVGLWHGASWNYILWGIYCAVFILAETMVDKERTSKLPPILKHLYSKLVVVVGFGIFYFTDFGSLGTCLKTMFGMGENGFTNSLLGISVKNNLFLLLAAVICCFPVLKAIKKRLSSNPQRYLAGRVAGVVLAAGLLIISSMVLVAEPSRPFLYLQF